MKYKIAVIKGVGIGKDLNLKNKEYMSFKI